MKKHTAKDIMNPDVITVPEDWSVQELAEFFVDKAISGAPVIDENENPVGIVSLTDIARYQVRPSKGITEEMTHDYYVRGWDDELNPEEMRRFRVISEPVTVREIMTPMLLKVLPDTPVKEIADTMVSGRIHRLLVVKGKRILGIITSLDLLKLIRDVC